MCQVISYALLVIVRDSCWYDCSFAPAGLIWQRIGSYCDQNFILAPLSRVYNKEEEPEIHRLAISSQQQSRCSGAYLIIIWNPLLSVFLGGSNAPVLSVFDLFFLSVQQFVCPTSSDVRVASASSWSSSVTPFRIALTVLTSLCVVRCLFLRFRCCVQACSTALCRALVFAEQYSFREEYFRRAFRTIPRETWIYCAQYPATCRAAAKPGVAFKNAQPYLLQ